MAKDRKLAGSKVGRRPQGEFAGKRAVLSTRITQDLRDRLEHAKKESGRSLSQEIELRLEQSFSKEDAEKDRREAIRDTVLDGIYESFGGLRYFAVMRMLADIAQRVKYRMGMSWLEDHDAFQETQIGINAMLEEIAPPAPPAPTDEGSPLRSVVAGTGQIGMWAKAETQKAVRRRLQEAQKQKAKS